MFPARFRWLFGVDVADELPAIFEYAACPEGRQCDLVSTWHLSG